MSFHLSSSSSDFKGNISNINMSGANIKTSIGEGITNLIIGPGCAVNTSVRNTFSNGKVVSSVNTDVSYDKKNIRQFATDYSPPIEPISPVSPISPMSPLSLDDIKTRPSGKNFANGMSF